MSLEKDFKSVILGRSNLGDKYENYDIFVCALSFICKITFVIILIALNLYSILIGLIIFDFIMCSFYLYQNCYHDLSSSNSFISNGFTFTMAFIFLTMPVYLLGYIIPYSLALLASKNNFYIKLIKRKALNDKARKQFKNNKSN